MQSASIRPGDGCAMRGLTDAAETALPKRL
jgi:hypothetical protein